jgi:hypothetical protein
MTIELATPEQKGKRQSKISNVQPGIKFAFLGLSKDDPGG